MSEALASSPAIIVARSPETRSNENATIDTVNATRTAISTRFAMKFSIWILYPREEEKRRSGVPCGKPDRSASDGYFHLAFQNRGTSSGSGLKSS